jgi:hypothetical protein
MMDRKSLGWFALALTTLALGCGDEEKAPSLAERKCKEACTKLNEVCDDRVNVAGCASSCASEAFRSDAYFETKADCVDTLRCSALLDGAGNDLCATSATCDLNECIVDELEAELSQEQEDLCDRVGDKVASCTDLDSDVGEEECLLAAGTLSPAYVEASADCFNEVSCDDVRECLDDVADTYDANVRLYSGEFE